MVLWACACHILAVGFLRYRMPYVLLLLHPAFFEPEMEVYRKRGVFVKIFM